jgi:hypothetical protein
VDEGEGEKKTNKIPLFAVSFQYLSILEVGRRRHRVILSLEFFDQ